MAASLGPAILRGLGVDLRYLRRGYDASRSLTIVSCATAVASALIPLGNVAVIGVIVGKIPDALRQGADSPVAASALRWTLAAGLLLAVQFVLGGLQTTVSTALGNRLDAELQRRLMRAVMRPVGIAHLERPEIASLVAIGGETFRAWMKPGRAVAGLCALFVARVGQIGGCVLLVVFNPLLALLLLAASLWAEYEIYAVAKRETAHHLGGNQLARRQDYYYDLGVTPGAAKEVRVFGLPVFLRQRFGDSWRESARFLFGKRQPRAMVATAAVAVTSLVALGWLTRQALNGSVSIGWASALAQATIMSASMLAATVVAHTQAGLSLETFDRYEAAGEALGQVGSRPADTRLTVADRAPADPDVGPLPQREIRFENVRFRYPGASTDVLDGLDLTIPAGRSLAIVGANGAGKTTLVKLLGRLYEPTEGRITVDGRPLPELDAVAWQRSIAPVFQDFIRYQLPARVNIGLGHPASQDDLEGIRAAAETARIADRLDELPGGWDTVLSAGYSGGTDLSGGEWQRLGLARALFAVRHGARILVLDEPAANLDARSEAELYEHFLAITQQLTTLVISHRFSTVRQASSIVVLSGGRVAEQGTHDELLDLGGRYAEMFTLQAARFGEVAAR